MVKICQTGFLKLYFETRPKKRIIRFFAKNFRRPWMKLKKFFCQFPNPWALRVSGMGGYTSKCEKSQNHCTLLHITCGAACMAIWSHSTKDTIQYVGKNLCYVLRWSRVDTEHNTNILSTTIKVEVLNPAFNRRTSWIGLGLTIVFIILDKASRYG
jgi:hypothetical protein